MLDYNAHQKCVQELIDEAAVMHWNYMACKSKLDRMNREHSRATLDMVTMSENMGRYRGNRAGIEKALLALFNINKRDLWRTVDQRARDMYGEYLVA